MQHFNNFPRFTQGSAVFNPGVACRNPVQEYNLIATPIMVIDPTNEAVVYTDTQEGAVVRFVLLQDDYLPMVEAYTASKLTALKELAVAREKLLAAYKPEQADILRRVVEAKVDRNEMNFSKIHDFDGVVKALEKLNAQIRETIYNVELVGVIKSIGYEGSEQVLQVSVQFKNKIDGVVTTVRAIKGPRLTPTIVPGPHYRLNGASNHYSRAYDPNNHKTLVNSTDPTHYVNALQKVYASRPAVLKDIDFKWWVLCTVFGNNVLTERPSHLSESFIAGVQSVLTDILNNELKKKLDAGYQYPGNVVSDFLYAFNLTNFNPLFPTQYLSEVDGVSLRICINHSHAAWLNETINFNPDIHGSTTALLKAVIELLK